MSEPLTLMDLKRKTAVHKLNGGEETIVIMGVTAKDYCSILERFQRLGVFTLGGRMNVFDMMRDVPEALAAWVAAACGHGGDPEAEKAALENLTVDQAMAIAEASMPLTFVHGGFGPFFERQTAVLAQLFPAATSLGKAQDTPSPSPSPAAEDSPIPAFGS